MPNHAQVTLAGHLGQDPQTRQTSGDSVTSFSLATNRKRKDGDITTWWRCTAWGKRGEAIARFLRKGDPILVTGEVCNRPWTDNDGNQRMSLDVDVRDFSFLGGKEAAQGASGGAQGTYSPAPSYQPAQSQNGSQGASGTDPKPTDDPSFDPDEDIPF